jgi:signal transduction histidine kinase
VQRIADTGQLAAGVVHELNNPLTAVTIFSESLLGKLERIPAVDPADLEKLRTIREAGEAGSPPRRGSTRSARASSWRSRS